MPASAVANGLLAQYFDEINLTGLAVVRQDPNVNFDFGTGSPSPAVAPDTFSARWSGQIAPRFSETYTFEARADDGVRLWVDNRLIIDRWVDQVATSATGTITLQAGRRYDIRMEYYENGGQASAQLFWASPSQAREIVPQSALYSTIRGNSQYILTTRIQLWEEAEAQAKSRGGNLVTINDAAEEAFLRQTFGPTEPFWTGLNDAAVEGQFVWSSGQTSTYRNFATGRPDNAPVTPQGEDFVATNFTASGRWNDYSSLVGVRGIIEIPIDDAPTPPSSLINYTSFADGSVLAFNGNATLNNGALRLTDAASLQIGSAFQRTPLEVTSTTSFSTRFSFRTAAGTDGADGLTFALQNDPEGPASLGDGGGFLGFGQILSSLGVEFDTRQNSFDTNNNNVSILANGDVRVPLATALAPVDLNSGSTVFAWVDYDGATDRLGVFVSGTNTKPATPTVSATVDLASIVGSRAFLGFTAATSGSFNSHEVLDWSVSSNSTLLAPVAGGSPGGIALAIGELLVDETSGTIQVEIRRTGGANGRLTVDYRTVNGTATGGSDFTPVTGTVVFNAGETSKRVPVPILNDAATEGAETFAFVIDNVVGGGALLAPRTAQVTIRDDESPLSRLINVTSFTDPTPYSLNGNASLNTGALRLTENAALQNGSAFNRAPLEVNASTSFSTRFSFRITGGTNGADGLTFALQNDPEGPASLGDGFGFLGFGQLANSVGVEFDTRQNSVDTNDNNVSILLNGDVRVPLATALAPVDLNSGSTVFAWIDYNAVSRLMAVYVSGTNAKPSTPLVTATVDLAATVGSRAFPGFTAATSGTFNAHEILDWEFSSNGRLLPPVGQSASIVAEDVATGFSQPMAVDWSNDGRNMYVAEKNGRVRVVRDGVTLVDSVLNFGLRINSSSDRGLIDIAVHPNLAANPYMYLVYTYEPPEAFDAANVNDQLAGPDKPGNRAGRVTRVTLDAATNYTTIVPNSEVVLVGKNSTWANFNAFKNSTVDFTVPPAGILPDGSNLQDFIAGDSESHSVDSVEFGTDGMLYVSIGDGTSYNRVDERATRVQDVNNFSGKLLRIDPITGRGLTDNPFYDGNPDSNRSKVFQYGFRNPFRTAIDPQTGKVYVGDVGWTAWEEINTGPAGANFGWPYFEGGSGGQSLRTINYQDLPKAQAFYASGQPVNAPLLGLSHAAEGINALILGEFYRGTVYPTRYNGTLLYNDLDSGVVRALTFAPDGSVASVLPFTTGAQLVVQMKKGPDGLIYYVDLDDGKVGRWAVR